MDHSDQVDLFVTADFPPGSGGESTYHDLNVRHYPGRCIVITVQRPDAREVDARFADCVRIVRVPNVGFLLPVLYFLYAVCCVPLKSIRFVHCGQLRTAGWACLLLRMFRGLPYGIHVYGGERSKYADRRAWRLALAPVLGYAHAIFANSRWTKNQFVEYGFPEARIQVVNPGVDDERFHPLPGREQLRERLGLTDRKVLLGIGRLDPHKGADMTLRALVRIAPDFPELLYVIGGTGRMAQKLQEMVEELGLADQVRFLGFVPEEEILCWYNAADIFAMPSRIGTGEERGIEGFGIVYLEANACNVPVIGGRSGGVSDAVEDGVNGLLADPLDPEDIARAIRELLVQPEFADRLGRQGRERVMARFTGRIIAGELHQAVARVLAGPRR